MNSKTNLHPLQTSQWAEFREAWGNEVVKTKYGYITLHKIPFTKYKLGMFIKGPEPTRAMLSEFKALAKENNLIFIKLEPNSAQASLGTAQQIIQLLKRNGCVPGKTLFTPTTFWIDLTITEEELLKSFSSKTRYNIRLAQKRGVVVKEDPTSLNPPAGRAGLRGASKAFEKYLELTKETIERQGFYAHTEKYHRLMWKHLHGSIAHLLTATYEGNIITTWILFACDGFLYYPYGASSVLHKDVMANNLVMWEAIKFGKKLGLSTFDLWGREPGKGFTRFKEGYNPKVVEFLGTWDLVI
ncbi:MAG: peptidoglycan bridge formation glycyltransferase FemA/FemB family protein, partial [bacterium]|nr:peptidoglycan bridge formation glycyltransferase FemA/FemB family protein [bacterium]